jgi:hypothetical protein
VPAVAAWFVHTHVSAARALPDPPEPNRSVQNQWLGAGTCTSSGCHAGAGIGGPAGAEYTVWFENDRHALAYWVLLDESSRGIEQRYRKIADARLVHAETDQTCLACHSPMDKSVDRTGTLTPATPEGVGCEACHGASGQWRDQHYLAAWKNKKDEEKAALGFRPLKNLQVRARSCVDCHVGTKDRNVDHDLLAAGHPRLNFEFAAYQGDMPKHWDFEAERKLDSAFDCNVWVSGQVESARAALELFADRASNPKALPEFSEYACASCHHDLETTSWRQEQYGKQAQGSSKPGSLRWGGWYLAMLPSVLEAAGDTQAASKIKMLQASAGSLPAAKLAGLARQALGAVQKGAPKCDGAKLDGAIARNGPLLSEAGWDEAAQVYLALSATRGKTGNARKMLQELRLFLDYSSDPTQLYDSPREDQSEKLRSQFKEKLEELIRLGH